ncbi:hypothetical protein V1514DRAFT_366989 [Lipomyces japonicus]|uniref:uncharacterized protein n=1 Tax=Lipomyces japonicus TaxID=56871 RepID=UPI0034CE264F
MVQSCTRKPNENDTGIVEQSEEIVHDFILEETTVSAQDASDIEDTVTVPNDNIYLSSQINSALPDFNIMNHFQISQRWKVAICTKCKVIACPKNIMSHFQDLHADVNTLHDHDFVRSQEIIDQANLKPVLQVGCVLDPALREKISGLYCCNDEPAYFDSALHMIPELPVHDGNQCENEKNLTYV